MSVVYVLFALAWTWRSPALAILALLLGGSAPSPTYSACWALGWAFPALPRPQPRVFK